MTSGLVISRLGVQATASDDLVHGLLCLRVPHPLLLIREANDRYLYLGRTIRTIQCDGTYSKVRFTSISTDPLLYAPKWTRLIYRKPPKINIRAFPPSSPTTYPYLLRYSDK
jgi:hypothetical protein